MLEDVRAAVALDPGQEPGLQALVDWAREGLAAAGRGARQGQAATGKAQAAAAEPVLEQEGEQGQEQREQNTCGQQQQGGAGAGADGTLPPACSPLLLAARRRAQAAVARRPAAPQPTILEVPAEAGGTGEVAAAAVAAATVSDDEGEQPEPPDPLQRGLQLGQREAVASAAAGPAATLASLAEALRLAPAAPQLHGAQADAYASAHKGGQAIAAYTTALELLEGGPGGGRGPGPGAARTGAGEWRHRWLLGRAVARTVVLDLRGAQQDLKAAADAAQTPAQERAAAARRVEVVRLAVEQAKRQKAAEAAAPMANYGSASIQARPGGHGLAGQG